MNDYNKYINFLNDNINGNTINSNINKKYLHVIYSDLKDAYFQLNNVIKKNEYETTIKKNKTFKKLSVDSYYFPNEYRDELNKCIYQIKYSFFVYDRKIEILFHTKNNNMNYIFNCFKNIYTWLHIVNKYGTKSCSETLKVNIYFLDFKKEMPLTNSSILDTINVNTAYSNVCSKNGEIVIYREEEWFKVFIHEVFHAYGLDFGIIENKQISEILLKLLKIKSKMYVFETYTETWATLWYIGYTSYNSKNNISEYDFCNYFTYYLSIEQVHSIIQSTKIMNHMYLTYYDLISNNASTSTKKKLYKENTNVFNYYILKSIVLYNCNMFIQYCYNNNNKLLNFTSTPLKIKLFINFIIDLLESKKTKNLFKYGEKIYIEGQKLNNYYINKSLRMTIV